METKHTKTPWGACPAGVNMRENYSQDFAVYEAGTSANLIAGLFGDVKGGAETAEANAALIVKAVNAFDELITFVIESRNELKESSPLRQRAVEILSRIQNQGMP